MATAPWWQNLDQQPPAGFGYPSWLAQYDGPQARNDPFAQFQASRANAQQLTDPLASSGEAMPDAFKPPLIGESLQPGVPNQVIPRPGGAQTASTGATGGGAPRVGTATASAAPAGGYSTAGRTGATYDTFLAANPGFDPWTNLDQYAGAGAGNDPILAQAFGWTNEWARNNGYSDGSNIPLAQRQRIFLANVERARQQWSDNANDPGARRNITWEQSQASRIPNQGWSYTGPYTAGANPAPQAPQAAAPAAQQQTGGQPVSGLTGYGGGSGQPTLPQALGGGTNQGTSHQGGPFGAIPDFDPTFAFQAAANSPSVAAGYIRAQQGQTGRSLSRMSSFRDNLYGKALQAYLALAGLGGNAGGGQGITDFISTLNGGGGGGGIMDLINRQAGTVAGQGFGGMDDATIEEALRAATALSSLNLGSVAGSGLSDQLDSLLYDQQMKGILTSGNDQSNLGAQFAGSPYQRALAAYTGMQGR